MKDTEVLDQIVLYPAIENLEEVHGMSESKIFNLKVNGKDAFVYHTREIPDEFEHVKQLKSVSYTGVSYVNFSTIGNVTLEINSLKSQATNWKVLPAKENKSVGGVNSLITIILH